MQGVPTGAQGFCMDTGAPMCCQLGVPIGVLGPNMGAAVPVEEKGAPIGVLGSLCECRGSL